MKYIYPDRESKSLEFKSQLPSDFEKIVKTCVAFANGVGGKIIIGVNDKTREIIGVDEKSRNRVYDEFPNSLFDYTSPSLSAEIYERNFGNNLGVIIIEIFPSYKKPVHIKREGKTEGVYLRIGTSIRRADKEHIEELERENKRIYYDEEPVNQDIDILSKDLLKKYLRKIDNKSLRDEKIIFHASSGKYYPTIAGVLMFSDRPDLYIPEAIVRCTRFQGTEGRHIIQTEEIYGCLEDQIEISLKLIKSWLLRDYQLFGSILKGKLIIPEEALREALINALIHRKYSINGSVKVALYDDRLEIFSPGNFPGLMDLNQLGDGTTYLRNPALAKIARHKGIIEKLGTGIRLIFESCQKSKLMKPTYIENGDSIKIIFHFLPEKNLSSSEHEKIIALFKMKNSVKISDVEDYLKVSRNTATRKLNAFLKQKIIARVGKGPSVEYFLNKDTKNHPNIFIENVRNTLKNIDSHIEREEDRDL